MKSIVYFLLSVCVIIYVSMLCVINIYGINAVLAWGVGGQIISGIANYGGIAIVFLYALVNFFGNPLKTVFFVLLVLVIIFWILTLAIPGVFRTLFGIAELVA